MSTEPLSAVRAAIVDFDFSGYGLNEVDPTSEYAEWVGDLASAIASVIDDGERTAPPSGLVRRIRATANADFATGHGRAVRDFARELETWISEGAEPGATSPAAFFALGALYRCGTAPQTPPEDLLLFRTESVAANPSTGAWSAFGWIRTQADGDDWAPTVLSQAAFADWTLVTEAAA